MLHSSSFSTQNTNSYPYFSGAKIEKNEKIFIKISTFANLFRTDFPVELFYAHKGLNISGLWI